VIPENMDRNLMGSCGLFYSQRVLMALLEAGLPRQKAYEMVQKVAMRCWEERLSFPDEVRKDGEILTHLSAQALDAAFDPSYYLRYEEMILSRVLGG
jgi:Adenylosuccinate lyase